MNKFLSHLMLFILLLLTTYLSTRLLIGLKSGEVNLLLFKIKVVYNSGFIFGLFNETSYFIRIVFSTVFLGLLTLLACYFHAILSPELNTLRWGITITLAGLTGNSLEKLIQGFVRDFICFDVGFFSRFYFNLNDVYQIIGFIIILRQLFTKQSIIWFPEGLYKRKTLIVYKDIQLPLVTKILGLIFIGSLTQGILAIALLFPQLRRGSQDVEVLFLLCLILINVALLPIIGRYVLHELLRSMGPIYALERYLREGKFTEKQLKFRKDDHFKSLEESVNNFVKNNVRKD